MPDEIAALRHAAETINNFLAGIKPKIKDKRPGISVRVEPEEFLAIHAAAAARGMSTSDLIRSALIPIIGRDLEMHRHIPANFQRRNRRAKPLPPTDAELRDHARVVTAHSIALRAAHNSTGAMSETAARATPKLGRR